MNNKAILRIIAIAIPTVLTIFCLAGSALFDSVLVVSVWCAYDQILVVVVVRRPKHAPPLSSSMGFFLLARSSDDFPFFILPE